MRYFWLGLTLILVGCGTRVESPPTPKDSSPALVSGIMMDFFDPDVRPGDDFFQHVNGQWLDEAEIPADKSGYGVANEVMDRNLNQLRAIVEELAAQEGLEAGSEAQKIRDLYSSYLDLETRDAMGLEPIQDDLDAIREVTTLDDLLKVVADLDAKGVDQPFAFIVDQDEGEATRYIGHLFQSGLGLPDRNYYLEDNPRFQQVKQAYGHLIATQWGHAGLDGGEQAAELVIDLETELARHHWTRVDTRDRLKTYNKMTPAELSAASTKFNWDLWLEANGLVDESAFVVSQPDYLAAATDLMASRPIEDWKTYFTWKVLDRNAGLLTTAMDQADFEFYSKTLRGVEAPAPMWRRGVQLVSTTLGDPLGKLYVARHFPPEAKQRMDRMVDNLIAAFDVALAELDWMGPETRAAARAKLAKVNRKIGYPKQWKDYASVTIDPGRLQANVEVLAVWAHNEMMAKLGQPVDRDEWPIPPQIVNAYYNPKLNEIVFPAGILQPPVFNLEADDAVNYGAIGMIIGHELGHAFDDQGSRSDGDGNLRNWWTDEDRAEFEKRTAVLVEQYNQYSPLEGVTVNGELTLGENIGDLGGTTIAYRAYMRSLQGREAPVLDGFTGPQRFFLGSAQLYRSKYREPMIRRLVMADPHSPKKFRVNGVVTNMPDFYAAFGVTEGQKLYRPPEERVKIW